MIKVTRLNGLPLWVNPDQIRWVEAAPDTIMTFADGTKIALLSTPDQINQAVLTHKHRIIAGPGLTPDSAATTGETPWMS